MVPLVIVGAACNDLAGLRDRQLFVPPDSALLTDSGMDMPADVIDLDAGPGDSRTMPTALDAARPEGGGPAPAECGAYCDMVMQDCPMTHQVFHDRDVCMAACAAFRTLPSTAGDAAPPAANTFECRRDRGRADLGESDNCPGLGPEGQGHCGTNCDGYCSYIAKVCTGKNQMYESAGECLAACAYLVDNGQLTANNVGDDTLQCRVYHAGNATKAPDVHCPHAGAAATPSHCNPSDAGGSTDDAGIPLAVGGVAHLCDVYCDTLQTLCTGATAVYPSADVCKKVCPAFQLAKGDTKGNSLDCRIYHTGNAEQFGPVHCPHAGPGGDGHCGGNCDGYCTVMAKFCPGSFADNAACMSQCATLPGHEDNSKFDIGSATGNTLQCRLLHASEAALDPLTQCPVAAGAAPCQ